MPAADDPRVRLSLAEGEGRGDPCSGMQHVSITGNLETLPLSDIVQFLGMGRKTGVLRLQAPQRSKRLVFEQGVAVYCTSGNPKEYLGQHLLARTAITEKELAHAFRLQKQTGQKIGEILVGLHLLTAEELSVVLRNKVADSMYEVFTWTVGQFEFEDGPIGDEDMPVRVPINWSDLAMEGVRRADELAMIRKILPADHVRLVVHPDRYRPGFPATGGDRKLVDCVTKRMRVAEILSLFHASDFDILSRLATLVREGAFSVDNSEPAPPLLSSADAALLRADQLIEAGRCTEALDAIRDAIGGAEGDPGVIEAAREREDALRARLRAVFPDLTATLALRVSLEDLTGMDLDPREAYLATRITGSWSIEAVVQVLPFGETEALSLLDGLVKRNLAVVKAATHA